jgi:beta-galactosidase
VAQLPLFPAPPASPHPGPGPEPADLVIEQRDGCCTLAVAAAGSPGASLRLCEATGALLSYAVGGRELLAAPLVPCFYRAATDNDRGGSGGASYVAR